jgi:GntR family transcriptional regulator, transcriptional repressor for pyruvate dehydrogenase complex
LTVPIEPIHYQASYKLAAERIRRAIELGAYLPGERLPSSRDFADQLGISVAALREAVRGLIDEGLLEMRRGPKGGLVVLRRPQDRRRRSVSKKALAEVEQLAELRAAVEAEAARLAAERRTDADLARVQRSFEAMSHELAAPGDDLSEARFNRADTEFHAGIARAAGNALFLPIIEDTRMRMFAAIGVALGSLTPRATEGHEAILNEIRRGRGAAAAKAARRHVDLTVEVARRAANQA